MKIVPLAIKITLIALCIGIVTGAAVGLGVYFGAHGEENTLIALISPSSHCHPPHPLVQYDSIESLILPNNDLD